MFWCLAFNMYTYAYPCIKLNSREMSSNLLGNICSFGLRYCLCFASVPNRQFDVISTVHDPWITSNFSVRLCIQDNYYSQLTMTILSYELI